MLQKLCHRQAGKQASKTPTTARSCMSGKLGVAKINTDSIPEAFFTPCRGKRRAHPNNSGNIYVGNGFSK
eukprot:3855225-Amphidinium_carterae.1